MSDLIPFGVPEPESRCQRTLPSGQCQNQSLPGLDRCEQHANKLTVRRAQQRNYDLQDAQIRLHVDKLMGSSQLHSLKEEISIIRVILSDSLKCINATDPLVRQLAKNEFLAAAQILEKLIKTSGLMDEKLGNSLTKDTVFALAIRIMEILTEEIAHIPDHAEIVDKITSRIAVEIDSTRNINTKE